MLTRLDAMAVGMAAWRLGAGRARKEDPVQAGAGVVWHARPGDQVREGEPLFTLLTDEPKRFVRHGWRPWRAATTSPTTTLYNDPTPLVIDKVG